MPPNPTGLWWQYPGEILMDSRQFDRTKQIMHRVVLKRDRAAQKNFFAALGNDTKVKDRDTINAFRR